MAVEILLLDQAQAEIIQMGTFNTFIGYNSSNKNESGFKNTTVGADAAMKSVFGDNNVNLGYASGKENQGSFFVNLGSSAGELNINGNHNVNLGYASGRENQGSYIVNVGSLAGEQNIDGSHNVNLGYASGKENEGNYIVNVGSLAGERNKNGSYNVNLGFSAGQLTKTSFNVNVGSYAGWKNTTGEKNVNIGYNTSKANQVGVGNVIVGYNAGLESQASSNTFIGANSGKNNMAGQQNTYLGYQTGLAGEGSGNVFIGYKAGENEIGSDKLYIDNSNTANPLIGGSFDDNHLVFNVAENGGSLSSFNIKTANSNANLVIDGNEIDTHNSPMYLNNNTAGSVVLVQGGGKVGIDRIPSTNALEVNGQASKSSAGDWVANSDARLKKNIEILDSEKMLQQLIKMQGVKYEWNDNRPEQDRPLGKQYGFIAQDLQKVWPENVSEDADGYLQTAYGTYDHLYVESVKVLYHQNKKLEKRVQEQETQLVQLNNIVMELKKQLNTLQQNNNLNHH